METSPLIRLFFDVPPAPGDDKGLETACRLLSTDEARRAARFHFEKDRRGFAAGRALVRRALSRCADVEPADWCFSANAHGRPEIEEPKQARFLRFSASRTDGLVMCAVASGREIGADLEKVRPYPADVATRYFTESEVAAIRRTRGAERSASFFRFWTLKEAYCKAKGLGLAIPLEKISFDLTDKTPRLTVAPPLEDDSFDWAFRTLEPSKGYLVSLCIEIRKRDDIALEIEGP